MKKALDLTTDRGPAGPWKLISCFAYLQRDLFPALIQALAPDGFLVVEIATVRNLERNARPSRRPREPVSPRAPARQQRRRGHFSPNVGIAC